MRRFCLRYQAIDLRLSDRETIVGREPECGLVLDDSLVSRKHASFRIVDDTVEVRDLGSRNGVIVNGTRVEGATLLRHGDRIRIGSQELLLKDTEQARSRSGTSEMMKCRKCGAMQAEGRPTCASCGHAHSLAPPEAHAMDTAAGDGAGKLQSSALGVVAKLADKAFAIRRFEEAERLLASFLAGVKQRTSQSGTRDRETVELATRYALRLSESLGKSAWLDYAFELHADAAQLMTAETVDEVYRVAAKVKYGNPRAIQAYLSRLRQGSLSLGASERFLVQRLEGLERRISSS